MDQTYRRRHAETIDYIQSMLGQLRAMAQTEHCDFLAYLIEMAYLEAGDIIRGVRPMRVAGEVNNLQSKADAKDSGGDG